MYINCDLGEGLDAIDRQVMPLIDMANIACGGHAGDRESMYRTVMLAKQYAVQVGAHPSYPDKVNFGRKSLSLSSDTLTQSLSEQIQALRKICQELDVALRYIKPHGALYHDLLNNTLLFNDIIALAKRFQLDLMVQAIGKNNNILFERAKQAQVNIIFEAFADRRYTDSGQLVARTKKNAVHESISNMVKQVQSIYRKQGLYSENNRWIACQAQSVCVHGDSPNALAIIQAIRKGLDRD